MKITYKIASGLIAVILATGLANANISVSWGIDNDGVLYDHDNTAAAMDNTWIFNLIADANNDSTFTSSTIGADDVILQTSTWRDGGGGWGQVDSSGNPDVADTYGLMHVYFQFFNADQSYCGYIYNPTVFVLPAAQGANPVPNSTLLDASVLSDPAGNLGNIHGDGWQANIQAIPEPTSMALFGIGAVLIGLRRKLRKA